ncbi:MULTISPECIES: hypothetical protein [Corallococcus]|uniref:hypothetical protein n=1 Tax=Corallococcus TaxID=83461 RepID=UPI000ECF1D9E|nr:MULTISPECIES: hypothetical protein [Corallococcus]NPD24655.1 hypothetical protein [Corallococcus exiguus]NRD46862.1 hypothetical protein [Corallococcus exiguus]RKI00540.1 hypothetical protein D7Y04_17195 [Corallococcus sp. AB038B]
MKRMTWVLVFALPVMALAQPGPKEPGARDSDRMARAEQRQRLRQVLELADTLELDSAQALKMDETLRRFEDRRRPLREQVRDSARILHLASRGDSAALGQVDAAAQKVFDARAQIAALDRELYQALAKDLTPEKRARLAVVMARSEGMKGMKAKGPKESRGD